MQQSKGLFFNTLLLGISGAVSKAATFLLMPFYTASLLPADFGAADLVVSTAVLLLPFVTLNAGTSLFRFMVGADHTSRRSIVSSAALLLLVGTLLSLLLLPLTALFPVLYDYRIYLLLYVLFASLHSFLSHYLRAEGGYYVYAVLQPLTTLVSLLLQILFIVGAGLGAKGYLLGILMADALAALFLLCYLRPWRFCSPRAIKRSQLLAMLAFGLPLMPSAAFWWLMALSDRYFILHYHGLAETGIYAAATRIPVLLGFFLGVFLEAWQYSALRSKENAERALYFGRVYRLLLPIGATATAALLVLSPFLLRLLFAPAYHTATMFVPFLVLAALFSAFCSFFGTAYSASLRSLSSLLTAMLGSAANFLLNFLLIPRKGALGAALATALAYFAVLAVRVWHTASFLPFARYYKKSGLALLLLFVAAFSAATDAYRAVVVFSLGVLLLFWRDDLAALRICFEKCRVLWGKRQKYQNKS